MNKFYCDRCGKEIGEEKDVHRFKYSWVVASSWAGYSRDLCESCAGKALHRLYPPDKIRKKPDASGLYIGWDHGKCKACGYNWGDHSADAVPPYCPLCGEDMSLEVGT